MFILGFGNTSPATGIAASGLGSPVQPVGGKRKVRSASNDSLSVTDRQQMAQAPVLAGYLTEKGRIFSSNVSLLLK